MYFIIKNLCYSIVISALCTAACFATSKHKQEIIQNIINEARINYSGNCPCPYNLDARGHRCGKRSSYSHKNGKITICYPEDITPELLNQYLKTHNLTID